jgi:hypothetical protein
MGLLRVVYDRPVCVSNVIRDVNRCPVERISANKIYEVVPGAYYGGEALQDDENGGNEELVPTAIFG